jgi:hypothetical protein
VGKSENSKSNSGAHQVPCKSLQTHKVSNLDWFLESQLIFFDTDFNPVIHTRSSPSLRQFLAQEPATLTLGSNCPNLFTEKKKVQAISQSAKKKR